MFLYGLTLVVGMRDTLYFHAQEQKARGNLWFLGWVLFVLIEWRSAIFIVKILGFLRMFRCVVSQVLVFGLLIDFVSHSGISVTILTFSRGLPLIGRLFAPPRFLDAAAAFKNTFSTKRPL